MTTPGAVTLRRRSRWPSAAVAIALLLVIAALGAGSNRPEAAATRAQTSNLAATPQQEFTPPAPPSPVELGIVGDFDMAEVMQRISIRYEATDGVWPGFVPNEHPVVLVVRGDADELLLVIAINHPDPDAMGTAAPVDTQALAFASLHVITEPVERYRLDNVFPFEFHARLGGVDSFAIEVSNQMGAQDWDYPSLLIHELFHRWQNEGFVGQLAVQDFDGYDYSAEHLELTMLETAALTEGIRATTPEDRLLAARHYAALRIEREKDPRVALDRSQERFEGTARFLEHITATGSEGTTYNESNFLRELDGDTFTVTNNVRYSLAFGRFYATGAGALYLAELLGIEDARTRVADGETPANLVVAFVDLDPTEVAPLVAAASAIYDPSGSIAERAVDAAARVDVERPIFGDNAQDGVGVTTAESAGIPLTDEQVACMEDQGLDLDDDGGRIPDDVYDACFPDG